MSSLPDTWSTCGGFALTYLIHSTCLLSICWLATLFVNRHFHAFHCQAWKIATLLGIATTVIAFISGSAFDARLGWSRMVERQVYESAYSTVGETGDFMARKNKIDSASSDLKPLRSRTNETISAEGADAIPWVAGRPDSDRESSLGVVEPSTYVKTADPSRVWQSSPLLLKIIAEIAIALFVLGMIRFAIRKRTWNCRPKYKHCDPT